MPAELDKVLYQIANAEWTKSAATRMFAQDLTPALQIMHQLACNMHQHQIPVEETFSLFFEPDAAKVLLNKSANLFWFWLLVQESVEQSRGQMPVDVKIVEFARGVLKQRMQARGVQVGQRPADMSPHEMGVAMVLGTVLLLQTQKEDGLYRNLIANPIFVDKGTSAKSSYDSGQANLDTAEPAVSNGAGAEPSRTGGLINADPDARAIQQQFEPAGFDEKYDFYLMLEGRESNGEGHPAVAPVSTEAIVKLLEELNAGKRSDYIQGGKHD